MPSIHDINTQLKDFITAETGNKHALPKNPYNVLWIIENSNHGHQFEYYKKEALEALKKDKTIKIENPNLIELLRNKPLIEKRLLQLIDDGADISQYILKIIRTKTTHILEMVVREKVPFDYNFLRDDGYYGLQYALVKKNRDIFNILWEHPEVNKELKNKNNESVVFHAVREKDWKTVEKIFNEKPNLFLDDFIGYQETKNNIYFLFDSVFKQGEFDKSKVDKLFYKLQKYLLDNNVVPIKELSPEFDKLVKTNYNQILSEKLDRILPNKSSEKKIKL